MFSLVSFDVPIHDVLRDQADGITHGPNDRHGHQRAKNDRFRRIARHPTNNHRSHKGHQREAGCDDLGGDGEALRCSLLASPLARGSVDPDQDVDVTPCGPDAVFILPTEIADVNPHREFTTGNPPKKREKSFFGQKNQRKTHEFATRIKRLLTTRHRVASGKARRPPAGLRAMAPSRRRKRTRTAK